MKRKVSLCLLVTLFWVGIWGSAQAETLDDNEYVATESSTLTVGGHGEVSVAPDRAVLAHLGDLVLPLVLVCLAHPVAPLGQPHLAAPAHLAIPARLAALAHQVVPVHPEAPARLVVPWGPPHRPSNRTYRFAFATDPL